MTEQRTTALDKANLVRMARADVKQRIARGEVNLVDLIWDKPEELRNMALFEIMMAQRKWGRLRVVKFLNNNGLSERLGLQTMTDRQRTVFDNAFTTLTWPPEGSVNQTI